MKSFLLSFLLLVCVIGCYPQSHRVFKNEKIDSLFISFVDSLTEKADHPLYFQIIAGRNANGVKVDFIATNAYMPWPLYYNTPIDLINIGAMWVASSHVSIYGAEGDFLEKDFFSNSIHDEKTDGLSPAEICNVHPIIRSYQVDTVGDVYRIHVRNESSPERFVYSEGHGSDDSIRLLLYHNSKIYYMFIREELIVSGSWHHVSSSEISLSIEDVRWYSLVKNEMITCGVDRIQTIPDGNIATILSLTHYRRTPYGLSACDSELGEIHEWIKEE